MESEPFELVDSGTLDTVLRCRYCGTDIHVSPEPPDDSSVGWDRVAAAMDLAESHLDECPALAHTPDEEDEDIAEDDYRYDYDEYYYVEQD